MGKFEPDAGKLDSGNGWEWKVRMEDLLLNKDLPQYMTIEAAQILPVAAQRNDRKALALVKS
jgi:hypothetical protein